ncbi:MAG TPA: hypothetical protein VK427_04730, partial [Kofleriaceae bacterium]|nr:hypothetical protein [Kofleriaceae bacterium]
MRFALCACVLAACGRGGPAAPPKKHDAAVASDAAAVQLAPLTLGLSDLAAYRWRTRAGHPAFRAARTAEAKQDWRTTVAACREALVADPGHLEAAWLLAAALGRLGEHGALVAPLAQAVAGDFGKWGHASLELPALQPFLATPTGEAWRARVEEDRAAYVAALARAVIVEADGDLFAFDLEGKRWHRVTRTFGSVVGALRVPAANKIFYVSRARQRFGIGQVDLARGRTTRPLDITDRPITLAYLPTPAGPWVAAGNARLRIDENNKLSALPPKAPRPPGPYLTVRGRKVTLHALPIPNAIADWDDHGLASAIRIGTSNRVVSVPSPGLIAGNTATWSADGARLAFVAQLADECTPGSISAAAFLADAATGKLTELERAAN